MKKLLLFLVLVVLSVSSVVAQTTLEGILKDGATGDPIIIGTVAIYKDGVLITGVDTDFDGHYLLSNLTPGTYDVEASYIGYTTQRVNDVLIKAGKANQLNMEISEGVLMDDIVIVDYVVPLIDLDEGTQGATVTAESIKALPVRDITRIAATAAGVSTQDGSDDISIRGARSGATEYYLDGIKMRGNLPPTSEIEQMQVITGGIEAKYGDVIGGIISLTSKGPSKDFRAGMEYETSEGVGVNGSNLFSANLSGPILKKTMENGTQRSIIGFRLSGQYRDLAESRPSYIGFYRMSESKINELEENPITLISGSPIPSAQFLHDEDVTSPTIRPNVGNKQLDLTAKLDFRLNSNMNITLSAGYSDVNFRSSPSAAWTLYNWTNNPYTYEKGYRGSFSFTHKLGRQDFGGGEAEESTSAFKNFYYTIQAGYEKQNDNSHDFQHEDDLFSYGFYGNKTRTWNPIPTVINDTSTWEGEIVVDNFGRLTAHQGFNEVAGEGWSGGTDVNPVLSKYYVNNGFEIANLRDVWNGLYSNVGQVYNRKWKSEDDIYSGNINFGFDIDRGAENRHSIQLGFNYEERVNRFWSINPRGLWQVASSQANLHITGINTDKIIGTMTIDPTDPVLGIPFGGLTYNIYANQVNIDPTLKFYNEVRKINGVGVDEFINVDGLSPSDLRLDMFSALELNNSGLLNYYGYDYLGNKVGTDTKFEDFFTETDGVRRTQVVAPLNPVYMAGYIQDKFKYKDIILRMGVRLDYFDANTKVLKDPYSLYEIETASEFYDRTGGNQPATIDDDYSVYVADAESENVIGYRKGDVWYLPSGVAVDNPKDVLGSQVFPAYKGRAEGRILDIQDTKFDINTSFKDYTPQINVMPRLSLSFPISDDAAFFAHYDVLVQRPSGRTEMTGLDYFYFEDLGRLNPGNAAANNPDLKPEKTIDYEVGFKKKLTETSAINVSAYYRELRDLIQRRFYDNLPAPVNKYETFGNIDFGTVKGFTFTFDKRRTNNLEFKVTYTLQFAKGTGSDVNSSNGLNTAGPIRNLLPLGIDERHSLNVVADYRFTGKNLGPKIFGKHIFANAGLNVVVKTVSGRPYTKRESPVQRGGTGYLGSLSGSRLPWNFSIDMKINKEFQIVTSSSGNKKMYIEVYGRVQNLLNTRNIIGVYSYTGDPDDDGYLASQFGLDDINFAKDIDEQSFLDTYSWRLSSPGNYTLPRRIYVGMNVSF